MTDTQVLLRKIAALRQQLEQVQGLAQDASSAAASLAPDDCQTAGRLQRLERQVSIGNQQTIFLDSALRQLTPAPPATATLLPRQLTARARRILEEGRALLGQLRYLADAFDPLGEATEYLPAAHDDPLARRFHETAAMAETAMRMVQAFPDAPSGQLRLCEGLDAMLVVIAERVAGLQAAVAERRRQDQQIDALADLLVRVCNDEPVGSEEFATIAETILADAAAGAPLRFLYVHPHQPARFIAAHSLTTAQVMARVAGDGSELRRQPQDAVLAALVHDIGMLKVDPAILVQTAPLDDAQRRTVEAHTDNGAEMLTRLLPSGAWLAEAAAGHHERLDGTGYPAGLRAQQLSPLTRLLAVCDIYAALSTPRPQRPAFDTRTALTDTLLLAERGCLDRFQAERLLRLSFYPVGSIVELADGAVGLVVATHMARSDLNTPARPVLAVLTDGDGLPLPAPHHVDLAQCEGRSVVRVLQRAERGERLGGRYPELV